MQSALARVARATQFNATAARHRSLNGVFSRRFATRGDSIDSGPSLLSQSLDQKRSRPRSAESVGPFQLGLAQPATSYERVKPWSELSTSGKVARTTVRTTNLTVILLGAGLSALLIYSLTSELFSSNSPTVLHNEACDRIKSSPRINNLLRSPLTFHNHPPSLVRPRHRSRHVASQILMDSTGREHMLLHFYVQGQALNTNENNDGSYWDWISGWTQESLNDLTWDDSIAWARKCSFGLIEKSKNVFRYVSGAPLPPPSSPAVEGSLSQPAEEVKKDEGGFFGLFSSLRSSRGSSTAKAPQADSLTSTDGEVHAELIRNDDGYFTFRYLLVDIPNSHSRSSTRVFIQRGPGVRENEPVMRWHSE